MEREKGFRLQLGQDVLYPEKTRNKSPISETGLAELKKSFRVRWEEIIGKITAGEFAPVPQDTSECFNCSWNTICRAPHMN
jgi:CRISPR/Cas system-associated exonuclease Cas4 (RecB family)